MTCYEIGILIWYYCRTVDYPERKEQLLDYDDSSPDMFYKITERGRAYVRALHQVPLPTQQWVVEWPSTEAA